MFLLEVLASRSNDSPEETVWRLVRDRTRAEKLWYQLDALTEPGRALDIDGSNYHVLAVRLWDINAADRAAAITAAEAGTGKVLKTTDSVIFEVDEQIFQWIKEPLPVLPQDEEA